MTPLGVGERVRLHAFLTEVRDEAARVGHSLLAVWRARMPAGSGAEAVAPAELDRTATHFSFELPARGIALVAHGEVASIETRGAERFANAERDSRELFADVRIHDAETVVAPRESGPILVGGFAFDADSAPSQRWQGFPALRFWLPERLLARVGGDTWRTWTWRIEPDSDIESVLSSFESRLDSRPGAQSHDATRTAGAGFRVASDRSPDAYMATVERALDAIQDGELEKIVVARACTLGGETSFDLARLLRGLRAQHPACFVFAVGRNGATFAGASPERLLRRTGNRIQASVLAGSAARGRTPDEDEQLGRALCECKKEQAEHVIVRRAVCEALAPLCAAVDAPESPLLLRLDGIQHLHTPVDARLRDEGIGFLTLAARLHPTPAVGGSPREAALDWLAANESLERGWYAGGVGWFAPNGDGEVAVALRSALLRGDEATLFAGAGVVAGSTPLGELAETRLKFRALLAGLMEI